MWTRVTYMYMYVRISEIQVYPTRCMKIYVQILDPLFIVRFYCKDTARVAHRAARASWVGYSQASWRVFLISLLDMRSDDPVGLFFSSWVTPSVV